MTEVVIGFFAASAIIMVGLLMWLLWRLVFRLLNRNECNEQKL